MQQIPKIVRDRLRTAAVGSHPQADTLTAFAEHSLSARERTLVLEHLAQCADCREVLALALPATEAAQIALRPTPRVRLSWPVLRWGLIAAGVVAVASVGILNYHRPAQELAMKSQPQLETPGETVSKAKDQPAPVTAATNRNQVPASDNLNGAVSKNAPATQNEKKESSQTLLVRKDLHDQANNAAPAKRDLQFPHGPKLAQQWQQNSQSLTNLPLSKQQVSAEETAQVRVPAPSRSVAGDSRKAEFDTLSQNAEAPAPAPPTANEEYGNARVDKAKPAAPASAGAAFAPAAASARPIGGMLVSSVRSFRWTINSQGSLERSPDGGATWQPVDVNANSDASSLQLSAKTSRAMALKAASPVFRAVSAAGSEVWAGGSGGMLYHSLDSGDHWTRISPAANGSSLTGDIISLAFSDTQHGRISTSTSELWTTADDGQTWQKQ